MLKIVIAAAAVALMAGPAAAQYGSRGSSYGLYGGGSGSGLYGSGSNSNSHYNGGYTNNHGTYVAPHMSTNPNSTQMDNYGTRGNLNPYTGSYGTRSPRY